MSLRGGGGDISETVRALRYLWLRVCGGGEGWGAFAACAAIFEEGGGVDRSTCRARFS